MHATHPTVPKRNRPAIYKTLLALEHHARPLKELVCYMAVFALAGGFKARSGRGGANSWELWHPDGRIFIVRARGRSINVAFAGKVTILKTRNDVVKWFESL